MVVKRRGDFNTARHLCLFIHRVHTVLHCAATLKTRIRPSDCGLETSFNGCSQSNMVSPCNNSIDGLF